MPRRTLLPRALSAVAGLALVAGSAASAVGASPPPGLPDACTQPSTGIVPAECGSAMTASGASQQAPGGTDVPIAAGNAYADGLTDAVLGFTSNQLTFPPGNMSSPGVVKAEIGSSTILGYDFSPDGSVLYGVENTTSSLFIVDQATGNTTTVGPMTKPVLDNWVDLTIDPATGAAYAASANGLSYSLFSLNLATGATTLINTVSTSAVPIDMSMNCAGEMYAETMIDNTLNRVDPATGALTVVGPLGVDINFAQGMDFDNATGLLHAWQVKNDTTTQYADINLATGTSTPFPGGSPPGEFEGAIKTLCPRPTATITGGPAGHIADPRPTFTFTTSNATGVDCSADRGSPAFAPCTTSYQPAAALAPGAYTFRVRATNRAASVIDTRSFTVVDCAGLHAAVAEAATQLAKAKKKLKAAKKSGHPKAIAKAKKKVKKAKQKLKAAKAALAAEPVC